MIGQKVLVTGVGLALAGLVSGGAVAQTKAPAAFGPLVDQVVAFFTPLSGEVIEVKDSELVVNIGRRDGAQAGMEFSLFREGRELRHPKTGEVLGRAEEELGFAVVSQAFETYSVARVASGSGIQPGDRVRISSGKIKLAVTLLSSTGVLPGTAEAVFNELVEELAATQRVRVINGGAFAAAVEQAGIPPERVIQGEGLVATAASYRIGHLLLLWVKPIQAKPFVEARLFSFLPGREPTPLVAAGLFVPSSVKATEVTRPGEESSATPQKFSSNPQPPEAPPSSSRSFLARLIFGEEKTTAPYPVEKFTTPLREVVRLGFLALAMDAAVAPQDKIPRLVLTDGERIYLYRIVGQSLESEWTYTVQGSGQIFSVQLADLNGDGVLEVVASRYSPAASTPVTSFILATRDGKPSVLAEDPGRILFAVDTSGDGIRRTLWAQRFNPETFFTAGRVERLSLRDGTLVSDGSVRVPRDFRVTGATLSNIAEDGGRALAYVDEQNRLAIATEGKEWWRSPVRVGGATYIKLEAVKRLDRSGQALFYSVEPMPLAVDLDGDGIEEVVVPQTEWEGALAVAYRSRLGYRLQLLTTGLEGTITGLGVIRAAGRPILILSVVEFEGALKKTGETRILMTASE